MQIGSLNTHSLKIGKYPFHESIYFLLTISIAVSMPFFIKFNSILIIALSFNWIIEGRWKEKVKRLLSSKYALIWITFFFYHAISILYSDNKKEGGFELEKKLSFLVFPLILSTSTFLTGDKLKSILRYFIMSCLAACLICLGNALLHYFQGDASFFFYHELGSPLGFHAVYFSMYIGFSIFILFYHLLEKFSELNLHYKWIYSLLTLFFFGFLILLSSKTIIVSVILIVALNFVIAFLKRKQKWMGLSIAILALVVMGLAIKRIPYINERFTEIYKENYSVILERDDYRDFPFTGGTIRLAIWRSVFDVLKEEKAMAFGVGIGDAQTLLTANYNKRHIYPGDAVLGFKGFTHYNAHNQYLQFLITLGVLGLMFFVAMLVYSFYVAVRSKNTAFLSMLILFSAFCFTESTLCAHKGVVFFLFFNTLYCTLYSNTSERSQ